MAQPGSMLGFGSMQPAVGAAVPAVVAPLEGAGALQAAVVRASSTPPALTGAGAVQAPGLTTAARPSVLNGAGAVQAVAVRATSSVEPIEGSGVLPGVGLSINGAPPVATIEGSGAVQAPSISASGEAGNLQPITGTGALQASRPRGRATVQPITGTGAVSLIAGFRVRARPATMAGLGSMPTPVIRARPSVAPLSGSGAVQQPSGYRVAAAPQTVLSGVGAVQVPLGGSVAAPHVIEGSGAIQAVTLFITGDLAVAVEVIEGAGAVQAPLAGVATAAPVGPIVGSGAVQEIVAIHVVDWRPVSPVGTMEEHYSREMVGSLTMMRAEDDPTMAVEPMSLA